MVGSSPSWLRERETKIAPKLGQASSLKQEIFIMTVIKADRQGGGERIHRKMSELRKERRGHSPNEVAEAEAHQSSRLS